MSTDVMGKEEVDEKCPLQRNGHQSYSDRLRNLLLNEFKQVLVQPVFVGVCQAVRRPFIDD